MSEETEIKPAVPGSLHPVVLCQQCRRSMRLWALDFRRETDAEVRRICLATAKMFRDGPCFHDYENAKASR